MIYLVSRARVRERLALARMPVAALDTVEDFYPFLDVVEKQGKGDRWRFSGLTVREWIDGDSGHQTRASIVFRNRLPELARAMVQDLRLELQEDCPATFPVELAQPPFASFLAHRIESMGPAESPVSHWQGFLGNLPGASQEEFEALGVDRLIAELGSKKLTKADLLRGCCAEAITPCLAHEFHWDQSITSGQWLVSNGQMTDHQLRKARLWRGRGVKPTWIFAYEHQLFGWKICRAEFQDLLGSGGSEFWIVVDHRGRRVTDRKFAAYNHVEVAVHAAERGIARLLFPDQRQRARVFWGRYTAGTGLRYFEFLIQVPEWVPTFYGQHFDARNVVVHVRLAIRRIGRGRRIAFIEEVQSDWHAGLAAVKSKGGTHVAPAPFAKEWPLLALKSVIWWARSQGINQVAWTTAEMQRDRWEGFNPPLRTYEKDVPKAARKLANVFGVPIESVDIDDFQGCIRERHGVWLVDDGCGQKKRFWSRPQAEDYASREGMGILQRVPSMNLEGIPKIRRVPLYGVGDAQFWFNDSA